ncbi:MAG: hypothetical protein AAGD07_18550 [Planctomycetota bacterium]
MPGTASSTRSFTWLFAVLAVCSSLVNADDPINGRVSPVLEIEVIDPGVDARGNPAVVLHDVDGGTVVDIPPTVLVHRYYYTGDRSFRGPNLPGGPSIVVANHPRTGERVYVPVQMLPGSPIVHYTHCGIEFDYGETGINVVFPILGAPRTKIRKGRKITTRVADALQWEEFQNFRENKVRGRVSPMKRVGLLAEGALLSAEEIVRPITQPAKQIVRLIPGVVALTDPQTEVVNAEKVYAHNAETRRKLREHRTRLDDLDQRTLR